MLDSDPRLAQLCQLLDLASSPDNQVQQQVLQSLSHFGKVPDFNMYLVTVFAGMPGQSEVVRQRAGLLLKRNILQTQLAPLANDCIHIQSRVVAVVKDSSKNLRHTAGSVLSAMVQQLGVESCAQTLNQLAEYLIDGHPDTVEGSFNALNKICEDGIGMLKQLWELPPDQTQHMLPFVSWCAERLLPRVFEYASPNAPSIARLNAIECLNHFALNCMLTEKRYPALHHFSGRYVEVLGILANDSDVGVLKCVCSGFVCVIEENWDCLNLQTSNVVLQYMLKACSHPEYEVRKEALEVWTPCFILGANPQLKELVRPMLGDLVPVLLSNMVYSAADYCGMDSSQVDADNADVPDQLDDIKPRFHKEQGGEDDDEVDGFGMEWTARKAAAASLDRLASSFGDEFLEVVLPLIEQRLQHAHWEVQESAVFALGAVAPGCMEGLVKFLMQVIELLLKLTEAQQPLLRSISCWCMSRFAQWICHPENPNREVVLRHVLIALLQRMLDRNKSVQEAACSAFATLEEEARGQLVPYVDDIVATFERAFQLYQSKNVLLLYDAMGTLAEGCELSAVHVGRLLVPLMVKFDIVADNDRSLVALFECMTSLAQNVGEALLPVVPKLMDRCVRLIGAGVQQVQLWMQNGNEYEKPDREAMTTSIDLLSGVVDGLGPRIKQVLLEKNFIMVLSEVFIDNTKQVRQSAFALVGDCAKNCSEFLVPALPKILPQCIRSLRENSNATVSCNASWAIGEICLSVGPEILMPYLDEATHALTDVLSRSPIRSRPSLLMTNVAITLGRLGLVSAQHLGKAFVHCAPVWCRVMKAAKNDEEKVNAFQGLCAMIKLNPQACVACLPELVAAICSFFPAPSTLKTAFREILLGYKQTLGPNWQAVYQQLPDDTRIKLSHMYDIGP